MKVIIINGSPRRKGITAAILHEIEQGLLVKGIEVMFYDLDAIKMAHCLGCCSCFQSGHCCIKDDAEKLSEQIAEADGVILGSPTYASNVSGLMKDFIDRGHFVIEQLLHGKYCITVSTGENYGNRDTSKVLGRLVVYSGGLISDSIVVKAPFEAAVLGNTQKQNGSDKEERKSICSKAAEKMIREMKQRKKHPLQNLQHFIVLNIGIKPFVKKKGIAYQGVMEKWRKMGI